MASERRSVRSRSGQRGFALISALVIAFLYFALMQLLLVDASRSLHEAQRFRARIVAKTLAENGAELAAINITGQPSNSGSVDDEQGYAAGTRTGTGMNFTIKSEGATAGVVTQRATLTLEGTIAGNAETNDATISIAWSRHSQ